MKKIFPNFQVDNFGFRAAGMDDLELTFKYINNKEIRSQSFSIKNITIDEHKNWFLNKIESEDSLLLLVEDIHTKDFLGQVRFDKQNDKFLIVGVYVNPDKKGKGLGSKILSLSAPKACEYFKIPKIIAQIKKENIASINAFKRAGYVFYKTLIIDGFESIEMMYQKHLNRDINE